MNIATGKTYETYQDAVDDGVHEADIAEVLRCDDSIPEVRFPRGPFKGRVYKRAPNGNLVRMDK